MMVILWIVVGLSSIILLITLAETLFWWHLWQKHSKVAVKQESCWKNAMIFLTGISDYAAQNLETEQIEFLQELSKEMKVDLTIAEPFPYDRLTAQTFSQYDLWRHLGLKKLPLWLISFHNFWQTVLVIILEKTYGNTMARCLINRLGLPPSQDGTLWFICGSVGASLALAAAPKLKEELQMSLIIITYGGVFRASPGFDCVDYFYDLIGEKDVVAQLGKIIFSGRNLSRCTLEKAKQENRFRLEITGEHKHMEYLSDRLSPIHQKTYRQLTLNTITQLLVR